MIALYQATGELLTHYELNVLDATLVKRATINLSVNVQYAWPHPARRYLYVVSSNGGPQTVKPHAIGDRHYLSVLRIDADGALHPHGAPQALSYRPVHLSLDTTGSYALVAYNDPSALTVHRVDPDATLGSRIEQPHALDCGIWAHQVLAVPNQRTVAVTAIGKDARNGKAEVPGALKLFRFENGVLSNLATIAPAGGRGFGPRNMDFHPRQPWAYVALERQSKLYVFRLRNDGLNSEPAFISEMLAEPGNLRPRQLGGAIHVHPNGRYVYAANRADHTLEVDGARVFGGGENSIAVYSIDASTGEPTLIQHADPHGFHMRNFALDREGRILVASCVTPMAVRDGTRSSVVSSGLSILRVGSQGKLEFVRKYDAEHNSKKSLWMGIVDLEGLTS